MAYAGQDYGASGTYTGNTAGYAGTGMSTSSLTAAHASGIIIGLALLFLIAIRMGFRGVSVSRVSGGLVRG